MIDLSNKLRPTSLETFLLVNLILLQKIKHFKTNQTKRYSSSVFYGKPGTGKTTLAKIIAREINTDYYYFNATSIKMKI